MLQRVRPIGVAAATLVAGALALAQSTTSAQQAAIPPELQAKPIPAGPGIITGRVLEADSSTGISGAGVTLRSPALGASPGMFTDGTPTGVRTSLTNGDGQFLFRGLPPGTYQLSAVAIGYRDGVYGDTRLIQIRRSLDLTRSIIISDTDRLMRGDIRLWKNAGLGGRVVDESGDPIVGAPVTAIARLVDWGGPVMQEMGRALTDDRGVYHIDVAPGDYIIGVLAATTTMPVASLEAYEQLSREGGPALTAYMNQVASGAAMLPPRGWSTRMGDLVLSQFADLFTGTNPLAPSIRADGVATIYPSTFYPASRTTATATVVTVASGEENLAVDLTMSAVPARRVAGQVIGPNGPIANLRVTLIPPDPSIARTSPAILINPAQAMTDQNGRFMFFGVPPGIYMLSAIRRPTADGEPTLWARMDVPMGENDVSDLVVRVQNGVRLSGRFVYDGQGKPPDWRRALVQMTAQPGSVGALAGSSIGDRVDENGRFTTREIIPGGYAANATLQGYVVKSITAGGENAMDRPFQVTSSSQSLIVTVSDRLATVTGIARTERGEPAQAATVAIFPADKSLWRVPGMASRRVRTAAPDRDGRYTFINLPAGDYCVIAVDWPAADFSDGHVLTKVMPSASRVTLTDTASVTRDLRVVVIQ